MQKLWLSTNHNFRLKSLKNHPSVLISGHLDNIFTAMSPWSRQFTQIIVTKLHTYMYCISKSYWLSYLQVLQQKQTTATQFHIHVLHPKVISKLGATQLPKCIVSQTAAKCSQLNMYMYCIRLPNKYFSVCCSTLITKTYASYEMLTTVCFQHRNMWIE